MCNGVSMVDRRLCGNPLVFGNISCDSLMGYGLRCTGTNQQCIYPWYGDEERRGANGPFQTCPDKSSQIFNISLTCREHLQQLMDFHDEHFCNDDWPYVEQEPICTNKTEWLSHQDPSFSDPHNCQSSCSSPGPDCVACTNPDYFICTKSGQCVHPDLVCDGHPHSPVSRGRR